MRKADVNPPEKPKPLSTGLGYIVRSTYKAYQRLFPVELDNRGVPHKQYEYLRALLEEDGISQIELSERVGMTRATVTGVIDTMERDGLVRRAVDANDRRIYRIHLTAKGRNLRGPMMEAIHSFQSAVRAGISDRDIAQFRRTAEKMQRNIDAALRAADGGV